MELLKLLLVDDDMLSIAYMRENFDWESYGYEIVGTAYNGKQALKQFRLLSPDLIISDVSMPLMDGVRMAHEIRAMGKDTHIVLLTAYNEFEYVRGAIQAKVDDYLIKDELTEAALRTCLEKIRARIARDQRIDDLVYQRALYDYVNEGPEYVGQHYPEPGIAEYISGRHHFWIMTKASPLLHTGVRVADAKPSASPEVLLRAFVAEQGLKRCTVRSLRMEGHAIAIWDEEDAAKSFPAGRLAAAFAEELHKADGAFSLMYTERPVSMDVVRALLKQGGNPAGCTQLMFGVGSAIPLSSALKVDAAPEGEIVPQKVVERLMACEDESAVERTLREALMNAHSRCLPYDRCRDLLRYVDICLKRLDAGGEGADAQPRDLRECAARFAGMIARIRSAGAPRPEVRRAIEYLNRNYGNPKLRLNSVAKHIGLSDSRLSVIFKEDTGRTVGQFLTDIRINRAKQLLLEGNLRIYEIANRVGCGNSQYFSTMFYKETGMYPSQYKKE